MSALPRFFPGDPAESADDLKFRITLSAANLAKVAGEDETTTFLAGLARTHHLRSIPRGTASRRTR